MPVSRRQTNAILHQDPDAMVTPAWLSVGGTSYAIRTVVRLDYRAYIPPTTIASIVFCFALVLICVCLWYLFGDILPAPLAWALLIASTTLMLYAAWFAFAVRPHYQVLVALLNGNSIRIKRDKLAQAQGLHRALREAMDWHTGGDILIDADVPEAQSTPQNLPDKQMLVTLEQKDCAQDIATRQISKSKDSAQEIVARQISKSRVSRVLPFLSMLHQKIRK